MHSFSYNKELDCYSVIIDGKNVSIDLRSLGFLSPSTSYRRSWTVEKGTNFICNKNSNGKTV